MAACKDMVEHPMEHQKGNIFREHKRDFYSRIESFVYLYVSETLEMEGF